MPPTDEPPAPNVPIDYTALLCRRPSGAVSIPDQPEKLAFLQRIYEENDQGSTRPDDSAGLARMGGSGVEERVPHDLDIGVDLFPPDNFAMVNSWLYRSSFPKKKHFPFLKTLGLRSVLYVCPLTSTLILEDYPEQNAHFLDENGITFFQYGIPGNKEPFVQIPEETITAALSTILDRRNHPMLIHCNKGKHRTGCIIGCLRKLQQWSLTTIFDEYRRFSYPKSRSMDQEFIELYRESAVWPLVEPPYLPKWAVLVNGEQRSPGEVQENTEEGEIRGM